MPSATRTDAELLLAARTDPQAFREFYERYAVWVRTWFQRQTGSETAALDLTAETFAQAWRMLRRFKDMADGSGAPWLFGIARNLLRQYHKHNRIETAARERLGMPLRTVAHTAAEPTGVEALLALGTQLWGDDDPVAEQAPGAPLLAVRRTAGSGRCAESEFELALHLPGAASAPLDLTRVGDDLVVTAAGVRRVVALPAALRRCTVTRARLDGDDLRVTFRPDPALWLQ